MTLLYADQIIFALGLAGGKRQTHLNFATAVHPIGRADVAAMSANDFMAKGEPKAAA